jgi:hypothetical protein
MKKYIDVNAMQDDIIKLRRTLDITKCSNDYAVGWITGVNNMEGLIDRQPRADVEEVRHGEYVYSSTDDKWHCSECFAERPRNNGDIPYSDIYCCYKCGAIMDGGKTK